MSLLVLITVAPASSFADPALIAALAAVAAVAYTLKVWLEPDDGESSGGGTTFDATVVIVLVALYVGGPAAAFAIWLIPDLLHRCVFGRAPLVTRGLAVNLASFAIATLCGAAILAAIDGAAGLLLAGIVLVELNFALSPLLYALLFETAAGRRVLLAEHLSLTPVTILMLAAGVATALLTDDYGLPGLLLLAAAVALPEVHWRQVADRFPAARPERERSLGDRFDAAEELLGLVLNQVDDVVTSYEPRPAPRSASQRRPAMHHHRMRGDAR